MQDDILGLDELKQRYKELSKAPPDTIQIMDGIYQKQGKKVDFIIKQRRLRIKQGKPETFSIAHERI